jgi:predicted RNA-binding Zn-ribbon protein involved in translation (DUF1610 family)
MDDSKRQTLEKNDATTPLSWGQRFASPTGASALPNRWGAQQTAHHRRAATWIVDARLIGMEQLPRLVSGNCPNCSSTEIIVKTIHLDGTNYEGYCPACGGDIVGALISGTTRAVVLK